MKQRLKMSIPSKSDCSVHFSQKLSLYASQAGSNKAEIRCYTGCCFKVLILIKSLNMSKLMYWFINCGGGVIPSCIVPAAPSCHAPTHVGLNLRERLGQMCRRLPTQWCWCSLCSQLTSDRWVISWLLTAITTPSSENNP